MRRPDPSRRVPGVELAMSCHQSVTIGPFLQYASPAKRVDHYDLLPDERLSKAFQMGQPAATGDVYLPNIDAPGVEALRINNEDEDGVLDLSDSQSSVAAFRKAFAREIEVLDAAYGTKGVVRFGVVVSWG